jgi:ketosteroid isomerase-like protein
MSQQNVEVVRQHIEAYAAGDAQRALSFLHPAVEMDISQMEMIDQEVLHGHAELAQYVRRLRVATFASRFAAWWTSTTACLRWFERPVAGRAVASRLSVGTASSTP